MFTYVSYVQFGKNATVCIYLAVSESTREANHIIILPHAPVQLERFKRRFAAPRGVRPEWSSRGKRRLFVPHNGAPLGSRQSVVVRYFEEARFEEAC